MSSSSDAPYQLKAYCFALRCKPAQERQLVRWSGQLRWVWNKALAEQRERRARGQKYAGHAQMCKWLTEWRNAPATAWLAGISREGSRWYASIQTRQAACQPAAGLLPTLGIALGVANFAATSQGALIEPLNALTSPADGRRADRGCKQRALIFLHIVSIMHIK